MTIKDYAKSVRTMRRMQSEYFKSRTPLALEAAKKHERMVDKATEEILEPLSLFDVCGGLVPHVPAWDADVPITEDQKRFFRPVDKKE